MGYKMSCIEETDELQSKDGGHICPHDLEVGRQEAFFMDIDA